MDIAIVSGSFDPITKGHLYVIEQAMKMAKQVQVLVAHNPDKKYCFALEERVQIVHAACIEEFGERAVYLDQILIEPINEKQFTAKIAQARGASAIVRGLRNVVDFEYEHGQQLVNNVIAPDITTIFVMPPPDLIAVSSSAIRGMVGIEGWEDVARRYIPSFAVHALKEKYEKRI